MKTEPNRETLSLLGKGKLLVSYPTDDPSAFIGSNPAGFPTRVLIALEYGITPIVALRQDECSSSLRSARQVDFRNGYDEGLDGLGLALREELANTDLRHHQDYGDDE